MPTRARLLEMLQNLDDRVQSTARSGYGYVAKQMPPDIGNALNAVGELVHVYRPNAPSGFVGTRANNTPGGAANLYATRALQAGGITAAGAGLLNLTNLLTNSFGGRADETSPDTLPM